MCQTTLFALFWQTAYWTESFKLDRNNKPLDEWGTLSRKLTKCEAICGYCFSWLVLLPRTVQQWMQPTVTYFAVTLLQKFFGEIIKIIRCWTFKKMKKILFVWCLHQPDNCRIGLLWEKDKYWQNAHLRLWWTGSAGFSPDFLAHVSFSSFFYIPTQPTPRLLNKEEKSPFSLADGSELGQMFIFLGCDP